MEGTTAHPVMAWRNGDCIRLLGSSGLSVEKCGSSLTIWVSADFHDNLYGLCGYYNGDPADDFTKRDLSQHPVEEYPLGSEFPESWEITGECLRDAGDEEDGGCAANATTLVDLNNMCAEINEWAQGSLSEEEIASLISDCEFDMCRVSQNTSEPEALNLYMADIQDSVEEAVETNNKTTDNDVMPEPLPPIITTSAPGNNDDEPTPSSGNNNDEPITSSGNNDDEPITSPGNNNDEPITSPGNNDDEPTLEQPNLPDDLPPETSCDDSNCGINVHVHVELRNP